MVLYILPQYLSLSISLSLLLGHTTYLRMSLGLPTGEGDSTPRTEPRYPTSSGQSQLTNYQNILGRCFVFVFMEFCGWKKKRVGKWCRDDIFSALRTMGNMFLLGNIMPMLGNRWLQNTSIWRKGKPLVLLVRMYTDTATMENSMEIP